MFGKSRTYTCSTFQMSWNVMTQYWYILINLNKRPTTTSPVPQIVSSHSSLHQRCAQWQWKIVPPAVGRCLKELLGFFMVG